MQRLAHPKRAKTLPLILSPEEVLRILLGHSSIRTTLRYTHVTNPLVQKLVSPLDLTEETG